MSGIITRLLDEARTATGLSDFGDYNEVEEWLALLIDGFMHIETVAPQLVRYRLAIALSERLQVVDANSRCGMLDRDPVFVVGVPRTGTSHLYGLLAACTDLRALTGAEARHPALRNDPEAQSEAAEWYSLADRMIPALKEIHPRAFDRPEELHWLTEHTLQSAAFPAQFPLWDYSNVFDMESFYGPLRFVRDSLEVIDSHAEWILKDPTALGHLRDYMQVFPRAKFIWIHRDPLEQVRSMCSLLSATHDGTCGKVDENMAYRALTKTLTDLFTGNQADSENPGRILHVEMEDLVAAPGAVISNVCEFIGADWIDAIDTHVQANPRPNHKYAGDIGGLNDDLILGVLNGLR